MSIVRRIGQPFVVCIATASCAIPLIGRGASPVVDTAYNGVVLDVRPVVTGNTANTQVNFGLNRVKELRTVNIPIGNGASMPVQLPVSSICEVNTNVVVPLTPASLGGNAHAGWIQMAGIDRAVHLAQAHRKPILFLEKSATADAKEKKLARTYAACKDFSGFIRVEKTVDDAIESPRFAEGLKKAGETFGNLITPRLACVDTRGRVIGVIEGGTDPRALPERAKELARLFSALCIIDDNIAMGDKLASYGKFNSALKIYTYSAECDPKEAYYKKLVPRKRKAIDAAAEKRLTMARELLAKGDRVAAAKLVYPIIEDGGDFPFVKEAEQVKADCRKL